MEIIPAIDLMDGQVVRLEQGDAKRRIQYQMAPADAARAYEDVGATRIHVVDLDGAFGGRPKNLEALRAIRAAVCTEIETGGGVRDEATVTALLESGADYIVVGTRALEDPDFLRRMLQLHGPRVIFGADARDGRLAARGWTADTGLELIATLERLTVEAGLRTAIVTDIARDGMFTSPNTAQLSAVLEVPGLEVIASGGVGCLADVAALLELNKPNLRGVIVGRALYDGRLSLKEAIRLAAGNPS